MAGWVTPKCLAMSLWLIPALAEPEMTTYYSKQDLRDRVLHDLGVMDIQETAQAVDAAMIDPIIQQSMAELQDENLITFDITQSDFTDNIPSNVFSALADFIRYHAGPAFTLPKDDQLRASALNRLRKSVMFGSDDAPVRVDFF